MNALGRLRATATVMLLTAPAILAGLPRPAWPQTAPPRMDLCVQGLRYVQTGDTTRAEKTLVAGLSNDPNDACALTNLGNLARLRGDLDAASVFYRMAMRADTSDAGILLNYAVVQRALGDPSADSLYRQALRRSRTLDDLLSKLALPRSNEADSLMKGSNISDIVGPGTTGSKRLPNPRLVAMLGKEYDEERHRAAPESDKHGQGSVSTNTPKPPPTQKPVAQANEMVLASLPLYWKN